jgi:hypothetical protein
MSYSYAQPKICNENVEEAVPLPSPKIITCNQCGPGQFLEEGLNQCEYCPSGEYQPDDYHRADEGTKIPTSCRACSAGYAALKEKNYEHFYTFPSDFQSFCWLYTTEDDDDIEKAFCRSYFSFRARDDYLIAVC